MSVKSILRKFISRQKILGFLDYYLQFKKHKSPWGAEFNGQHIRREVVLDILSKTGISQAIETGTFRGTTTRFFVDKGLEVYTCEYSPRYYFFSYLRFRKDKKLHIENADSRAFLKKLSGSAKITSAPTFFYLDAHWSADLPLAEELAVIDQSWTDYIIMIDDFQVPGDDGYYYDDYGGENVLNDNYLKRTGISFFKFYPVSSENETGVKSGCIVLTRKTDWAAVLNTNPFLKSIENYHAT